MYGQGFEQSVCIFRHITVILPINPFNVLPGPCPGILILITIPIPDRVRASLQLIHYNA